MTAPNAFALATPVALARVPPRASLRTSRITATVNAPKRVRFLFSDTGGGHRASAKALKGALESMYPGRVECDMVDLFVESGVFPFSHAPAAYNWMAANPWAWKAFFETGATPMGLWLNEVLTDAFCGARYRALLASKPRPDAVISVHPLMQGPAMRALSSNDGGARTTPFATVVTDLGSAHPAWFHPDVDACFVPSDALHTLASERGLRGSQIVQHGLPIRPGFCVEPPSPQDKVEARRHLGLAEDKPTALVVGGGDGMGGLEAVATAVGDRLAATGMDAQVAVICGRNEAVRASLSHRSWPSSVDVQCKGFVDNMDTWMKASDVLVTKAGPGTIAEAASMGLPCVLSAFLPGQEEGNVDFVRESGFGEFRGSPDAIADTCAGWLGDAKQLETMSACAAQAARPGATADIARDIAALVLGKDEALRAVSPAA